MKQTTRAKMQNTQNFPKPAQAQTRPSYHRRECDASFVTQFKALAQEPEKQKLMLDAVDRFQRMGADAEGCRQLYRDHKAIFELNAGQGIYFVAIIFPFAEEKPLSGFLFAGTQAEAEKEPLFDIFLKRKP